jgi:hypothetical protein
VAPRRVAAEIPNHGGMVEALGVPTNQSGSRRPPRGANRRPLREHSHNHVLQPHYSPLQKFRGLSSWGTFNCRQSPFRIPVGLVDKPRERAMPFIEGSSRRIIKQDDGTWGCIDCGFTRPKYQEVIGHLGKHAVGRKRPSGRPKKATDPSDMTFTQMAEVIDTLRQENVRLTADLREEQARNARIRSALSDFMGGPKDDH